MKTDELIGLLAQDAPVRDKLLGRLLLAFLLGMAVATGLFAARVGIRPDVLSAGQTVRFLFKVLLVFALFCISAAAVSQVGRPEARLAPWGIAFAALTIALGIAVAAELFVTPESLWGVRLVGQNAVFCLVVIPTLAVAPLAFLLFALRGGAPARPGLAGAIAGLAASGMAATLYAIHCPDDSPLFVATWYSIATALVTGVGYVAGSRLLRW
ncbi:NrsF family protein [Aquabacter sp. CN5-332]|uniref:NrsF family protein n=1 Tax=Aquabacter sp. CN5-332 TaxID=3156608 RepID=UPI0032B31D3F